MSVPRIAGGSAVYPIASSKCADLRQVVCHRIEGLPEREIISGRAARRRQPSEERSIDQRAGAIGEGVAAARQKALPTVEPT